MTNDKECPRCGSFGGYGCYECIPDHTQAELQAAVAAEREACALVCDEYSKDHGRGMFDRHSNECANRIRARIDTDAQAALEAVKREARNEALREAAAEASYLANDENNHRPKMSEVTADILSLMEGTANDTAPKTAGNDASQ